MNSERIFKILGISLIVLAGMFAGLALIAPSVRIGDPESAPDPAKLDPGFPDMEEWAKAGVEGGIPHRESRKVVRRIGSDDNLQKAIDEVADKGGGVILLAPGRYPLPADNLDMKSRVALRGEDPDKCILEVVQRPWERLDADVVGVRFEHVEWAGLEDLTIIHPDVAALDPSVYREYANNQNGITNFHIGHIYITSSRNCWVDNCRLLYAGTDPLVVWGSDHITLRDNLVRDCFNKGPRGNGYYLVRGSKYVLCCNEIVKGLRHFSIQEGSKYCVVLNCYLEVDLNFHARDEGHNLVEGCLIRVAERHPWPPIATWTKYTRGEGNILYKVDAFTSSGENCFCVYWDRKMRKNVKIKPDPQKVFGVRADNTAGPLVYPLKCDPPRKGTFYPVTGICEPASVLQAR